MKKKLTLIIAFILAITSIPIIQPSLATISLKKTINASIDIIKLTDDTKDQEPIVTDLIAEQIYDVGDVIVWNEYDTLYVKYVTTGEWRLSETYVQVDCELYEIPQIDGNPIISNFEYKSKHEPMINEYTYEINRNYFCNVNKLMCIAANALVCKEEIVGGLDYIKENLPNVTITKAVHAHNIPPYNQSYFKTTINYDKFMEGEYKGWCVDLDSSMTDNKTFCAKVYPSWETIPLGLLEKPYNLDLVNYIINQHYVGKPSGCIGNYTYGDVQRAIWTLIEDQQSTTGNLGPWSQCRVNEILTDANDNGEGFIPTYNQIVAIILAPTNIIDGQISIIEFPIKCELIKTYKSAWGAGFDFPGDDFATYFNYVFHDC
jgi:hypothetical protein